MKKIKTGFICLVLAFTAGSIFAQDATDMMSQYKAMSESSSEKFPSELDVLMPKGFTIKTRGFVYKQTSNMFMFAALSGTRKNVEYPKFGLETEIEVGIMAYNPQSASYMSSQMPLVMQAYRNDYSKSVANESEGQWEISPVAVSKINQADVYIQKCIRKSVELDNFKYEDQVYYFVKAAMLKKNVLLTVSMVYYPQKKEGVDAAVNEITKAVLAADFDKFMK